MPQVFFDICPQSSTSCVVEESLVQKSQMRSISHLTLDLLEVFCPFPRCFLRAFCERVDVGNGGERGACTMYDRTSDGDRVFTSEFGETRLEVSRWK